MRPLAAISLAGAGIAEGLNYMLSGDDSQEVPQESWASQSTTATECNSLLVIGCLLHFIQNKSMFTQRDFKKYVNAMLMIADVDATIVKIKPSCFSKNDSSGQPIFTQWTGHNSIFKICIYNNYFHKMFAA